MDINKLVFEKQIYPRHRDLHLDNEIKLNVENVERIRDYITMHKKLPHKITYNKPTHHILDGNHTWEAAKEEGWKDIPKEYLVEVDIPIEKEMWVAAQLNAPNALTFSRNEVKAIFMLYCDKNERMKYGTLKEFSQDFTIPYETLRTWLKFPEGRQDSVHEPNSKDEGDDKERIKELEKQLREACQKIEALEEIAIKWENRPTQCPKCKTVLI